MRQNTLLNIMAWIGIQGLELVLMKLITLEQRDDIIFYNF
jgi:hypothetical protein